MAVTIDVSSRGPIFDGRARAAANQYVDRLERDLAETGVELVREELHKVLKHPTGYYESRITVERGHIVTDQGVVYGPWLAGLGSRNFPVTRFRGYQHWRRAVERLRARRQSVAERLLRRYVGRM
ncbi:hypothetical protein [Streptomyces sp. NPDC016845]|uniref:hypothetical protein n=1 Tax=Streptomyces sp. NPDC016845 TaxID=3364972 RepID=UPI003791D97A